MNTFRNWELMAFDIINTLLSVISTFPGKDTDSLYSQTWKRGALQLNLHLLLMGDSRFVLNGEESKRVFLISDLTVGLINPLSDSRFS
jgi:hypothetical protein